MPLKQTALFDIRLCIMMTIILYTSCKVSDTNLIGKYETDFYDRSIVCLDSSKKFRFWSDDLKLVITGQNFFFTQGIWERISPKKLLLNSISDSIPTPLFDVDRRELDPSKKSKFIFVDQKRDTISIYQVFKNRKTVFARPHGPLLTEFEDSSVKNDTLYFVIVSGFSSVEIPITSNIPTEYLITLNREFRPGYFQNTEFLIRRNKLIRMPDKAKFKKDKPNGI